MSRSDGDSNLISELLEQDISCLVFWNTRSGGIDIFVVKLALEISTAHRNSTYYRLMNG